MRTEREITTFAAGRPSRIRTVLFTVDHAWMLRTVTPNTSDRVAINGKNTALPIDHR